MRARLKRLRPAPVEQPEIRASRADEDARFADERRLRDSGGPDDRCLYSCSCGFVFEAGVTTSVRCPHCGDSQAW